MKQSSNSKQTTPELDLGFLTGAAIGEWREINQTSPQEKTGCWLRLTSEDSVDIVDFQPAKDGAFCPPKNSWVLRRGSCGTEEMAEFSGWNPEFEDAINGFRVFETRGEIDEHLRAFGIMSPKKNVAAGTDITVLVCLPDDSKLEPMKAYSEALAKIAPLGAEAVESRFENIATDVAQSLGINVLFEGDSVVFYDKTVSEGYARTKAKE